MISADERDVFWVRDSVQRADFDNLQAVVNQIADQIKWFADNVSEDMTEPDDEDAPLDVLSEDSGPVIPVGVVDESDTLNDLQAFYADNENVAADIDPQLSSIIGNLMKDRLPEEKLKGELNGYIRPGNCPTLVDTMVNPEIWDKLSPPTRSRDIKLQRIQQSLVQAAVAVAVATGGKIFIPSMIAGTLAVIGCDSLLFYARISLDNDLSC